MNENLKTMLAHLHSAGAKHVDLIQKDHTVQDYYTQRASLLQAQAMAISEAVNQVQEKFAKDIWQLEQEYAVYLSMITPQRESQS